MCIVDEDEIVREIFPMPARLDIGINKADDIDIRIAILSHWEFFRRYMADEDIAELSPFVTETYGQHFYQPTMKSILRRLLVNFRQEVKDTTEDDRNIGLMLLCLIFYWIPMFPIIYLVNKLQGMPKFPDWIETECEISENDNYNSLKYPRKMVLTEFTFSKIMSNIWLYLIALGIGLAISYIIYGVMGYYLITEVMKGA